MRMVVDFKVKIWHFSGDKEAKWQTLTWIGDSWASNPEVRALHSLWKKFKVFQCHVFSKRATWEAYVDRCVPPLQREKKRLFPLTSPAAAILWTLHQNPVFLFFLKFFALKCTGIRGLPAARNPSPRSHIKSQTSSVTSHFYQGNGCDRALLGVANQAWLFVGALQSEAIAVRLCHVWRLKNPIVGR